VRSDRFQRNYSWRPRVIGPAERSRALYSEGLPSSYKVTRGCRSGRLPEITSAVQRRRRRGAPPVSQRNGGLWELAKLHTQQQKIATDPDRTERRVRLPPVRLTVGTDANSDPAGWESRAGADGLAEPLARRC
jgi:hypothetical protein